MRRSTNTWVAVALLATALSMLAGKGHAATRHDVFKGMDQLEDNWPEAGLEAWINDNPKDPTVVVGKPLTYSYRAKTSGYVSMVHVDSHGTTSLIFPGKPGDAQAPIRGTYPTSGVLEPSPPFGKETVYVVLTKNPLDPAAFGAAPDGDFVRSEDSLDLAGRFAAAVSDRASSSQVALTRFHYFVEDEPGAIQYTFRGIKRLLYDDRLAAKEAAKKGAPIEELKTTLPNKIGFAFGSNRLTAHGRNQLDVWGELLLDESKCLVTLIGHTDDIGTEEYNLDLSRRRAQTAHDYIVENFGVAPSRLKVRWRGESDPRVPNVDDESQAENRRVDFVLTCK